MNYIEVINHINASDHFTIISGKYDESHFGNMFIAVQFLKTYEIHFIFDNHYRSSGPHVEVGLLYQKLLLYELIPLKFIISQKNNDIQTDYSFPSVEEAITYLDEKASELSNVLKKTKPSQLYRLWKNRKFI